MNRRTAITTLAGASIGIVAGCTDTSDDSGQVDDSHNQDMNGNGDQNGYADEDENGDEDDSDTFSVDDLDVDISVADAPANERVDVSVENNSEYDVISGYVSFFLGIGSNPIYPFFDLRAGDELNFSWTTERPTGDLDALEALPFPLAEVYDETDYFQPAEIEAVHVENNVFEFSNPVQNEDIRDSKIDIPDSSDPTFFELDLYDQTEIEVLSEWDADTIEIEATGPIWTVPHELELITVDETITYELTFPYPKLRISDIEPVIEDTGGEVIFEAINVDIERENNIISDPCTLIVVEHADSSEDLQFSDGEYPKEWLSEYFEDNAESFNHEESVITYKKIDLTELTRGGSSRYEIQVDKLFELPVDDSHEITVILNHYFAQDYHRVDTMNII